MVSRSVSMVAPVSALTMLMSYPSFSRANIEKIVPMSLKETAITFTRDGLIVVLMILAIANNSVFFHSASGTGL